MTYQIDQSGKIEETAKKTVLGMANDHSHAVILSSKAKRRLQEWFRRHGIPTLFVDITFSSLIFLLWKSSPEKITSITVDVEYPGHTTTISSMVDVLTEKFLVITWKHIGKHSPA